MSKQSGDLDGGPSVSELQATVDALRADLVEATERIRELEVATDGITPGGGSSDGTARSRDGDTESGAMDPGALDALADGSLENTDEATVGDLAPDTDSGGAEQREPSGMPGRDPTSHPQDTQDAELVDAGSPPTEPAGSSATSGATDGSEDPSTAGTSPTETAEPSSSETTDDDDDSDDIIVA